MQVKCKQYHSKNREGDNSQEVEQEHMESTGASTIQLSAKYGTQPLRQKREDVLSNPVGRSDCTQLSLTEMEPQSKRFRLLYTCSSMSVLAYKHLYIC